MEDMQFETLIFDPSYEIAKDVYPPVIRKKGTKRPIKLYDNGNGYIRVFLSGDKYYLHRVLAEQYIPNPNKLPQVDHRNKHRDDNHVENLRWITKSDNDRNKTAYGGYEAIYVDELDGEAIEVDDYGSHSFEFYYFYNDKFYYYNGVAYRELHVNVVKNTGALYVYAIDKDNKQTKIYYNKFKKLYDLI